jgi:cytochrome P450
LINPDLLKDFFTPDQVANYPKNNIAMEGIRFMLGEGMLFSEGAKWKHRRRLISNAFNF